MRRRKIRTAQTKPTKSRKNPSLKKMSARECRRRATYEALYERHKGAVFAVAFALLFNADDANDVLQITFAKLWERLNPRQGRATPLRDPDRWLIRVAGNTAKDLLKSADHQRNQSGELKILEEEKSQSREMSDAPKRKKPQNWMSIEDIESRELPLLETIYGRELATALDAELATFPKVDRKLWIKRRLLGMALDEIHAATGIPRTTIDRKVKSLAAELQRRLKHLARCR